MTRIETKQHITTPSARQYGFNSKWWDFGNTHLGDETVDERMRRPRDTIDQLVAAEDVPDRVKVVAMNVWRAVEKARFGQLYDAGRSLELHNEPFDQYDHWHLNLVWQGLNFGDQLPEIPGVIVSRERAVPATWETEGLVPRTAFGYEKYVP